VPLQGLPTLWESKHIPAYLRMVRSSAVWAETVVSLGETRLTYRGQLVEITVVVPLTSSVSVRVLSALSTTLFNQGRSERPGASDHVSLNVLGDC
jgi:hypothetical protein